MSEKHVVVGSIRKLMRRISSSPRPTLLFELAAMGKSTADSPSPSPAGVAVSLSKIVVASTPTTSTPGKSSRLRKMKQKEAQTRADTEIDQDTRITNHHYNSKNITVNNSRRRESRQIQVPHMLPPLFSKTSSSASTSQSPITALASHSRLDHQNHFEPDVQNSNSSGSNSNHHQMRRKNTAKDINSINYLAEPSTTAPASRSQKMQNPDAENLADNSAASSRNHKQRVSHERGRFSKQRREYRNPKNKTQSLLSAGPAVQLGTPGQLQLPFRERPGMHPSQVFAPFDPIHADSEVLSTLLIPRPGTLAQDQPARELHRSQYFSASYPPQDTTGIFASHPGPYPFQNHSYTPADIAPQQPRASFRPFVASQTLKAFGSTLQFPNFSPSFTAKVGRQNKFDRPVQNSNRSRSSPAIVQNLASHYNMQACLRVCSQPLSAEHNGLSLSSQRMTRQASMPVYELARMMSMSQSHSTLSPIKPQADLVTPTELRPEHEASSNWRVKGPGKSGKKTQKQQQPPHKDAAQSQDRYASKDPVEFNPAPIPTKEYLEQVTNPQPVRRLAAPQPLLVVVDLNGTLILRRRKYALSLLRPGFWRFLNHCFNNPDRYKLMIWTTARPESVKDFLEHFFSTSARAGFLTVWCRDRLGFNKKQYKANTQAYKRLEVIWAEEMIQRQHPLYRDGFRWSQNNTVLVDDSIVKAAAQPHNLIHIPELTYEGLTTELRYSKEHNYTVLQHVVNYLDELSCYEDVSRYMFRHPISFRGF